MKAIVKKLEVQGFKSFEQRSKIIFHPGITAIVGPNGTGKSNIVDALLWVMGGLRLKSVRGDRTEDVIFNGNAKKAALGMAEVVLSLEGEDEDFTISHRVFRSGEGEYRLNGKSARLRDIQDELRGHGIGEKEYFVIEQGSIGDFVTSKPNEKRGLIEEAAGTAYYKEKKRQAQNKLENTELNLTRLEDILIEVEKAKNSLQRQAQAANRYRRLRERIRELQSHHYRRKLNQLEQSLKHTLALFDASVAREKEIGGRVREEEKKMSGIRAGLWDRENALKESQERHFGMESQISRLESDIERESKRSEYLDEKKKRAESDKDELLQDVLLLTKELEDTRAKLTDVEEDLAKNKSEVDISRNFLEAAKEAASREDAAVEDLRSVYLRTLQETTGTRNEAAKLEKEIELLTRQEEKLYAQIEENNRLLEENAAAADELEAAIADHSTKRDDAANKVRSLKGVLADAQTSKGEVRARLDTLKANKDEAVYHLQALRKIEERERGEAEIKEVPGALGLLVDLIQASPENAPLLDAFWRDEARAQVVSAEEFLENIPDGLKGHYVLIPPQAGPPIPEEILQSPGFVGLLKTRFESDAMIKDRLFYFENAVIVTGIKEAIGLWMRHPTVNFLTPSGDLLHSSGYLRLGQKSEGMIALASEIRELEAKVERMNAEIAPVASELNDKSREEVMLSGNLEDAKNLLVQEEKELKDKQKDLEFVRTEREKIRTILTVLTTEIENLQGEKNGSSETLRQVNQKREDQENRIRTSKEEIESKERTLAESLGKVSGLEQEYHEKKSGLDVLQEKMNSLRFQIQSTEKRKGGAEGKIASLGEEIQKSDEEKVELERNIRHLREKIKAVEKEKSGSSIKLDAADAEIRVTRQNLEDFEDQLQKVRDDEARAKDDRMKFEIRKAEIERDIINLEEVCWQELKKTIPELKAEWEGQVQPPSEVEAGEEGFEDTEEESSEETGEAGQGSAEAKTEEQRASEQPALPDLPKPRRTHRKWRPVSEMTDEEVEQDLEEAREQLTRYKAVNLMAEEEYVEQKKRHEFLSKERQDLRESIASTQEAINKIDEESKVQFLKAIEEVNSNFLEVFKSLFKGGNAEVKLLDESNPLESGVEIVAQPPGKRVQNLSLLSGGEKSLTSLAFLFALFRYKPSPFCFLDEVDAALDDANLARFLDLLNDVKHQTQFVLVTHNYKTMEVADYIYGTTMEEPNITKIYSVKLEKKEKELPL